MRCDFSTAEMGQHRTPTKETLSQPFIAVPIAVQNTPIALSADDDSTTKEIIRQAATLSRTAAKYPGLGTKKARNVLKLRQPPQRAGHGLTLPSVPAAAAAPSGRHGSEKGHGLQK